MGAISSLGSDLTNVVKSVGQATKTLTDHLTNDVGGNIKILGEVTGDPVLAALGLKGHEANQRSQAIKDIEANLPKAIALYYGGEYVYSLFGGGAAGGAAGGGLAGAGTAGTGGLNAAAAGGSGVGSGLGATAAAGGAAALTGAAGQTAQTSGVIAEIASVVGEVEQAINGFIKPIADTVNEINNGIIQPIVGPIKTIMDEQQSLRDFIHGDLHSGIMGLLELPGNVADALTSVDASFTRAIQQLTTAQQGALGDALSQNGPNFGSVGAGQISAGISSALPGEGSTWTPPGRMPLDDTFDVATMIKSAEDTIAALSDSTSWYDRIWLGLMTVMESGGLILAQHRAMADAVETAGRRDFPETILQVGDLMKAYQRGELTRDQCIDEMLSAGINSERGDILLSLTRNLPSVADLLQWNSRGLLTQAELTAALGVSGYAQEDIDRYIKANATLPSSGDAVTWWHRGVITDTALTQLLTAIGYNSETQQAIKDGSYLLPQLADLMALYDRELALTQNAGANLAADEVPQPFVAEAHRLGISAADASTLWANHLQLLPPPLAVGSYFRGYINREQLYAFTRAAGMTRDITDMYVDALRPQLPYRTIPTLVKAGILNEADAISELKALGFTDIAVDRLLRLSSISGKAPTATTATTLHKDVQTTTVALYNEGTLDRAHAEQALMAAGLDQSTAEALLNLEDVKNKAALHKTEVDTVVAQVGAGSMTIEQGTAALAAFGLNHQEQARATTRMNQAARRRTKIPAEGTLLAMYRRKVISEAETTAGLESLGYSATWADRLIKLEQASHG